MAKERTFSILKPDVTRRNLTGAVNARIEAAGLRIVAQKRVHMTRGQAETFYGVHTRAPVLRRARRNDDRGAGRRAGAGRRERHRQIPRSHGRDQSGKGGAAGTIRKEFALSMGENSVHGSDAPETAAQEIAQFFSGNEIVG